MQNLRKLYLYLQAWRKRRSDDDEHRRQTFAVPVHHFVMNAVKLLAIATVTVAVTLLCIRSGQAMAKNHASAGPVYHPTDGIQEVRGKLLATTKSSTMMTSTANNTAPTAFSIAESTIAVALNDSGTTSAAPAAAKITVELNRPETNGTRDAEERERTPKNATSRALVDGKGHEDRSSRSRSPSIVVRGKLIKAIPTDRYGENPVAVAVDDDSDGEENDDHADNSDADIVVDTEVYRANRYEPIFS